MFYVRKLLLNSRTLANLTNKLFEVKFMKPIAFLAVSLCFFSPTLAPASDVEMLTLEQELLSLEDELIQSSATPFSEEAAIVFETEKITEPFVVEASQETPFINLQETLAPISLQEETPLTINAPTNLWVDEISGAEEPVAIEEVAEEIPLSSDSKTVETISFKQVFSGSPLIYSILLVMSLGAITLSLYSVFRMQNQNAASDFLAREIRHRLLSNNFQSAFELCQTSPGLLSRIVLSALNCRKHGLSAMIESMKAEGKRATLSAWQRLGLLQDIAVIAPMLGLLGTVVGLFYAFYDLNRSFDSMNQLLDGLGISVGTTVAGIGVAILSMILHSTAKFRLVQSLARVETEATALANLMDEKN